MKSYPSVASSTGSQFRAFEAYVFDKIDGSNLRWEWSSKRGWYKFGTKHRLFDETDPHFAASIKVFFDTLAQPLHDLCKKEQWQGCTAFTEFWGENSFAGLHEEADEKHLTLIDLAIHKQGFLEPKKLVKLGKIVPTPYYLGRVNWTRGFVEQIRRGEITGVTFEGVVGKAMSGRKRIMAKAKTQAWIDKVRSLYPSEKAETIIKS